MPDELLTEVPWTLPPLRRWWNASKEVLAPWWAQNSKEAYNSGLDALARGLQQYSASRSGRRRGAKTGFPRFKSRHRSRVSCRFTTGAIRVDDGMHVVLPRIGRVKTHERTTALLARIDAGTARILAATVSSDGRRWHCAFTVEADREPGRPAHAGRDRAHLVAAAPDGTEVAWVPAPRSLARAQGRLRALQRRAARQAGPDRRTGARPSHRWRRTQDRIGRVHARAANICPARPGPPPSALTAISRRKRLPYIRCPLASRCAGSRRRR